MLILHVITDLRTGGAEIQLKQLVLGSDPSRFRHVVVSLGDGGPLAIELQAAGVEVHSLCMKRGLSSLRGIVRLMTLLRRIKPDVLHGWLYHGCLMSLLGVGLAGVPHLIWGIRSANPQLQGYGFITRRVVYLCARLSRFPDTIIVNSEAGRIAHQELGFETTKMTVIPNGVDVELYRPDTEAREAIREELALSHDTLLIGMFARYSPMKDHDTFLRAVSLVHPRHPHVHFLLAGKGIDMNNNHLSQLLRKNRIHNVVHLLGIRRDMPRLTAALDIACLSSWNESFPNVIAEAMSCAIPCIATNVGDVAKIVGRAGQLIPARTPQALADSLFQLVELDPVERQKLGHQGRQRMCSEFSAGQALRLYDSMYENFRGYVGLGAARSVTS
jgi:glycosyltransferase involved in cell wall biosynthesis